MAVRDGHQGGKHRPVNVILAGVGGQGLVLLTKIIAEAAFHAGHDLKTTDVIGLSQRGGQVSGTIRFGPRVHSPNIPEGEGDFLIAMEPLEGLRLSHMMKTGGHVIMNERQVYPTSVMMEAASYPEDIAKKLSRDQQVTVLDAFKKGKELGTEKLANTILLGIMAQKTDIPQKAWEQAIEANVPPKFKDHNLKAFEFGYTYEGRP